MGREVVGGLQLALTVGRPERALEIGGRGSELPFDFGLHDLHQTFHLAVEILTDPEVDALNPA